MKKDLVSDLNAGIVVFLIAVPLCLGIALASGAPLFSGIITGIVGGIVVGILSKSQLSVCGPAAGLTAIVLNGIEKIGAFEGFLVAVVIAGAIQILLGALQAGTIAYYFPSNVIKGMLTGIGIIIILKQINFFIGYDKTLVSTDTSFTAKVTPGVFIIGLCSLGFMLLWDKFKPKKLSIIPSALIAVLSGVGINELYKLFSLKNLTLKSNFLVNLPIYEGIESAKTLISFPDINYIFSHDVWIVGITIAIVATIETLLTIEATDRLDPEKRITPTSRELVAQGAGNMFCGLFGGIPLTSVIVRSSANINAGAKSNKATIFHGILLLIGGVFLGKILNLIPLASLAAILIVTGYKLASPKIFKKVIAEGKRQWIPFLITCLTIVFTDLLTGVVVGLCAGFANILSENFKNTYYFHKEKYKNGDLIHIVLSEQVTFLNKAAIAITLDNFPKDSYVLLDASHTTFIDHDVLEIIKEFIEEKAISRKIRVYLQGFKDEYQIENNTHILFEKLEDHPELQHGKDLRKEIKNNLAFKEGLGSKEAIDKLTKLSNSDN